MNTQEPKIENLMDGLLSEMNRVREVIRVYESLPDNAGMLGAAFMKMDISTAERAIVSGDVVQMLASYSSLKETGL